MNCDRCGQLVSRPADLIYTAFAADGGHFCERCYAAIEPEVNARYDAYWSERTTEEAERCTAYEQRAAPPESAE